MVSVIVPEINETMMNNAIAARMSVSNVIKVNLIFVIAVLIANFAKTCLLKNCIISKLYIEYV